MCTFSMEHILYSVRVRIKGILISKGLENKNVDCGVIDYNQKT